MMLDTSAARTLYTRRMTRQNFGGHLFGGFLGIQIQFYFQVNVQYAAFS